MKTITELTCYPDGTQVLEQVEVPDDYFGPPESDPEPTADELMDILLGVSE